MTAEIFPDCGKELNFWANKGLNEIHAMTMGADNCVLVSIQVAGRWNVGI
jgi:hypothetical protein